MTSYALDERGDDTYALSQLRCEPQIAFPCAFTTATDVSGDVFCRRLRVLRHRRG